MKCKIAKRRISLLCDERLSESEKAELDLHLKVCPDCRNDSRAAQAITSSLESLEPAAPLDGGWQRLSARMEADHARGRNLSPAYALALCAVFAVALILFLVIPRQKESHSLAYHLVRPIRVAVKIPKPVEAPNAQVRVGEQSQPVAVAPVHRRAPRHHSLRQIARAPAIAKRSPAPTQSFASVQPEAVPAAEEISAGADKLVSNGLGILVEASFAESAPPRSEDL